MLCAHECTFFSQLAALRGRGEGKDISTGNGRVLSWLHGNAIGDSMGVVMNSVDGRTTKIRHFAFPIDLPKLCVVKTMRTDRPMKPGDLSDWLWWT